MNDQIETTFEQQQEIIKLRRERDKLLKEQEITSRLVAELQNAPGVLEDDLHLVRPNEKSQGDWHRGHRVDEATGLPVYPERPDTCSLEPSDVMRAFRHQLPIYGAVIAYDNLRAEFKRCKMPEPREVGMEVGPSQAGSREASLASAAMQQLAAPPQNAQAAADAILEQVAQNVE